MTATSGIALFAPSLHGGGAERVMVDLAAGFAARGIATDLVVVRAQGPHLARVPASVRLVDLDAPRILASLPALVRYLRRERPATLIATLSPANLVALWARRLARVPTRVVVREANTLSVAARRPRHARNRTVPWLARRCYPWADGVVAVSDGVAQDLGRTLRLPPQRIRVLPNPVLTRGLPALAAAPLDDPWLAPGAPPVVLGVGRLEPQKDFATLLEAVALLRRADGHRAVRLVVLGEGGQRAALEAQRDRLGLADAVRLPGYTANPYAWMARAAAFVLSSAWEGSPGVLIEALACGAPVVATDCPSGPREILAAGRYGRLVPVGDAPALAAALAATLEHPLPAVPPAVLAPYTEAAAVDRYLALLEDRADG